MKDAAGKIVVQRFIELLDKKEIYKLGEVLSDNVVWHGTGGIGMHHGMEEYKRVLKQVFDAFPDSSTSISILLAEGDLVAVRYTIEATHREEFLGFPPTEGKISMATNMIVRTNSRKIEEIWHGADLAGLMMANYPVSKQPSNDGHHTRK